MATVILGCPTYDKTVQIGTARALYASSSDAHVVIPYPNGGSLLNDNCNKIWATALNHREEFGAKWFAMLHADIEPDRQWIDTLIAEAEKYDADMVSACIALKDERGLTSTAIASEDGGIETCGRISFKQLWHSSFPDTFDINMAADALEGLPPPLNVKNCPREFLLLNTGCMVCRLDKEWCDATDENGCLKVIFDSISVIRKNGGVWQNVCMSEDWLFSMRVAAEGGKVMATRKVSAIHYGLLPFMNDARAANHRLGIGNEIVNAKQLVGVNV